MEKELQVFEFEGKRITFDFGDGEEMVSATEIIKAFEGKRLRDFAALKQTKEFIKELERSMNTAKGEDSRLWKKATRSVRGGNDPSLRGIWYEKRLALKLAAWLNPKFEVWVFTRIAELLRTGQTQPDIDVKTLEFVFQKIKDNAMEIHYLSDIIEDLKKLKK
jgi:hypothetical protein